MSSKKFSIFVEQKKLKQMAKVIDYTPNVFTHYYFQDGAKYCFTVYPGFFVMNKEDKRLDLSDYDFVVGIGPQGSYSFQLYFKDGKYTISKGVKVNRQLLKFILKTIREWSKTHKVITEYDDDRIIA
jgi:hypothetical protein